jgi:DNA-binding MarR family transcriptional regulator
MSNSKDFRSMIPSHVLLDPELTANDLRFYCIIESFQYNGKGAHFSFSYIAKVLNITIDYAKKIARKLKKKNYIKRFNDGAHLFWQVFSFCLRS